MIGIIKGIEKDFEFKYTKWIWLFCLALIISISSLNLSQYVNDKKWVMMLLYIIFVYLITIVIMLLINKNKSLHNYLIKVKKNKIGIKTKLNFFLFITQIFKILSFIITLSLLSLCTEIFRAFIRGISPENTIDDEFFLYYLFVIFLFFCIHDLTRKYYYNVFERRVIGDTIIKYKERLENNNA